MSWMEKFSLKGAGDRFEAVIKRFPATLMFTAAFTIILMMLIWNTEFFPEGDASLFMLLFYPPTAVILALSLHLWSEEQADRKKSKLLHIAVQVVWFFVCLCISLALFANTIEFGVGMMATVTLICSSVFFLSFLKKRENDIEAWNFGINLIFGAFISSVVSGILLGGIELLLWGIEMLFGLDISGDLYLSLVIICMVLINTLLFLMQIPEGEAKHNRDINRMNDFGRVVVHALFVPLQGAYLLTLYVYVLFILIAWELPMGGVVWLVTTMMVGMLFIITLVYPLLFHDDKPFDKKLVRWLSALALPLLVLMTVGILRRISDYGFTVPRAYVLLFNIWCYVVCAYLYLKKARHILWILVSFVLVFFISAIGPWNISACTRRLLTSQVDDIFAQTGVRLPLDYDRFDSLIKTMDRHEADLLKGKLSYLQFDMGEDSLVTRWLDGLVDLHTNPFYDGPDSIDAEPSVVNPGTINYPTAYMSNQMIEMPQGDFIRLQQVDEWQEEQNLQEQDSMLYMIIPYYQDTLSYTTTFEVPFKRLQEIDVDADSKPFVLDNGEASLLIWNFEVTKSGQPEEDGLEAAEGAELKDFRVEGMIFFRKKAFEKEPIEEEDEEDEEYLEE